MCYWLWTMHIGHDLPNLLNHTGSDALVIAVKKVAASASKNREKPSEFFSDEKNADKTAAPIPEKKHTKQFNIDNVLDRAEKQHASFSTSGSCAKMDNGVKYPCVDLTATTQTCIYDEELLNVPKNQLYSDEFLHSDNQGKQSPAATEHVNQKRVEASDFTFHTKEDLLPVAVPAQTQFQTHVPFNTPGFEEDFSMTVYANILERAKTSDSPSFKNLKRKAEEAEGRANDSSNALTDMLSMYTHQPQ